MIKIIVLSYCFLIDLTHNKLIHKIIYKLLTKLLSFKKSCNLLGQEDC